jgi:hypothetical protein
MGNKVMIGEHQMEQMIDAVMIDDINVANVRPQESM